MIYNRKVSHLGDRLDNEFDFVIDHCEGKGVDVGGGPARLSPEVLMVDREPYEYQGKKITADVYHDCRNLEIKGPVHFNGEDYHFKDGEFDYIFSSHCLEDFEDIPTVFMAWWKKIKVGGVMILLLPDIEGGRYPEVGKGGNPSHRTNVGKNYLHAMLLAQRAKWGISYEIIQEDTIPHDKGCSIDFVIKKLK